MNGRLRDLIARYAKLGWVCVSTDPLYFVYVRGAVTEGTPHE